MSAGFRIGSALRHKAGPKVRGLARMAAFALLAARPCRLRHDKDLVIPDDPPDKLYNEGLYLLQQKSDYKRSRKEIRGSRPPAPLFRLGAQGAADAGLCLLRGQGIRRYDHGGEALCDAASRQPGRGLCAIPDRLVLLRSHSGRDARPAAHRKGDERTRAGDPEISEHRICRERPQEAGSGARPVGRQGNDDRPLSI